MALITPLLGRFDYHVTMGKYPRVSHTGVTRVLGRGWSPRGQLISLVRTPDPTIAPTGGREYLYLVDSSPKLWPLLQTSASYRTRPLQHDRQC
jgi:hypothetical protein